MTTSEVLSVRLSPEARRVLAEAAPSHDAAGASALAREILERWAEQEQAAKIRRSVDRAVSYLRTHDGWDDDPSDFFPGADPR